MRKSPLVRLTRHALLTACAIVIAAPLLAQSAKAAMQQDPACQSLTPVSAGGPAPKDPNTLVVRWLGWTNYELAYRGEVFLLDAYYDRGRGCSRLASPRTSRRPTRSSSGTLISITSPTRRVANQTGAGRRRSFASERADEEAACPAKQFKAVKGGEVLHYPGVTVEAALGHHNVIALRCPEGLP